MYPFPEGCFAVRNAWYVAAWSHDVTRTPLERWYLDEPVVLYRREDGSPVAMAGRCPHRHFPMAAGRLEGDTLVCGYHGIAFASDGRCTRIPTQDRVPPAFCIRIYPIAERWRWLWIWMGDPALADESLIPNHDALDLANPDFSSEPLHYHLVEGRYQLLNDNLLDLSHLAYLHQSRLGMEEVATQQDEVTCGDAWVRSRRMILDAAPAPVTRERHGDIRVDFLIDFTFHAPALHVGANLAWKTSPAGPCEGELLMNNTVYHAVTPATRHSAHYFFARTAIHPADTDNQQAAKAAIGHVIDEDIFATREIERLIGKMERPRDLLTRGDQAVTRGRLILQKMMMREREAGAAQVRTKEPAPA
jgi:phenylpropionate dioxygenase-like ring-hydroxylating dioxygenase large terminal subunit